ncbi:MAG: helix-turn-helix transcriptional regulator [Planctomycetia bacterium]|nr:helix-turn-helix transcriptional regulator [Planctomycetia bacterium]
MPKTRNFAAAIRKMLADDPALRAAVQQERLNATIASMILEAREAAGKTQREVADLVGTHQSAIARLEDTNYTGHSLNMLQRIADALGVRLKLEFEPIEAGLVVQPQITVQMTFQPPSVSSAPASNSWEPFTIQQQDTSILINLATQRD